jgi:cytochrome c oxidase assembly protein subunit 15
LVAAAVSLYDRREFPVKKLTIDDRLNSALSRSHILFAFVVIVLGTLVTGSGPHAGDEKAQRFGFDIQSVSILHADAVIALFGLTLALFVAFRGNQIVKKRILIFTAIALAQGLIGYIQYFTGIPEILVAAHLLGAALVWIAAWRIRLAITTGEMK